MTPERSALLRAVPATYDRCVVAGPRPPIDVAVAAEQHAGYRAALDRAGVATTLLPADEAVPDCPFVEDVAVILGEIALIARPGEPARRAEAAPVADWLDDRGFRVEVMTEPATLDGGDVLIVGGRVYVGVGARTNRPGFDRLAELASAVGLVSVAVGGFSGLHLKSVVNRLDDGTLIVVPGAVDERVLAGCDVVMTAPGEERAANVLDLGGRRVLMPDGCPVTAARVTAAGFSVTSLAVGEFEKGDGGLTCLSLRW
jgi:dimethylargininase